MELLHPREICRLERRGTKESPRRWAWKGFPSARVFLIGPILLALFASGCSTLLRDSGPPPGFGPPREVAVFPGAVLRVSFSPDGRHVALCGEDNAVRTYRADTWNQERVMETTSPRVRDIGWNPRGDRIAAVANDGVRVFAPDTGKEVRFVPVVASGAESSPEGFGAASTDFLWSPSGGRIAVSGFDNGVARVYSGEELEGEVELRGHFRAVTGMEWGPEEKLFTASWDGTVRRWDVASGKWEFLTPNLGPGRIRLASLDSIGAMTTMSYGDTALLVWDMRSGELKRKVFSSAPLVVCRVRRDARMAALADTNGSVWIREVPGWNVKRMIATGGYVTGGYVEELRWSPDGRYLAGKSAGDPAVAVWDVATGGAARLRVRDEEMISMDWSPDGRRLITGSRTGKIREWTLAH